MGKKSSKSSTTTTLPAWAQGLAQQGGNMILNTVSGNQGNLDSIAGSIRNKLPGLGDQAFGAQAGVPQGIDYIKQTLGGKYLNSNPYIDDIANRAEQDAANSVNSTFGLGGRTGSMSHAAGLARGVADANNAVRFGAYNAERQNQNQAAGMLPSLVSSQYAGIPAYLGAAQAAGQLPYAGIGNLGQLGDLYGGQGTTSSTQPGGWGTQLLGAAASALPFVLSERSKKTKIELIRREPDGLGIYRFAYKMAPEIMLEGPMADEVEAIRPWALGPTLPDGSRTVNYAALNERVAA